MVYGDYAAKGTRPAMEDRHVIERRFDALVRSFVLFAPRCYFLLLHC